MELSPREVKILYFASGCADKEIFLSEVFGKEKNVPEKQIVTSIEDFNDALDKEIINVVLIDHTANFKYTAAALDAIQHKSLDLPIILLIDEASEQEAIGFLARGVNDYIFLDRPYRLPISLRKIRKKYHFKAEKEMVLQELREKSAKLQTAQRIAKLGYWEYDLESSSLFWTEEVYTIWGRNQGSFTPNFESLVESIFPRDKKKFLSENEAALAGLRGLDVEHRIVLPDGSIKWVHERGALAFTEAGKRIFEGTVRDITDEKLNSQKLVTNESRLLGILKSQTNYLIRIDLEGNYSYCNEKFSQDFKWIFPDQNLIGKPALSSVKESSRSRLKDLFYKCLSRPNVVIQDEIEKLQEDGGEKYTIWDFVCLADAEGNPVEIQGVGIDITDRVEAEQNLLKSNQRYELATKATSDAIYDWDCLTGKIMWSSNYSQLFGYSQGAAPENIEAWFENVHSEDAHLLTDLSNALEGAANFWQVEYRYRRSNGKYAHVLEKGTIIRNEAGRAVRMVGALQDITERKEAMQKLIRSEARHKGIIQSQTNYVIRIDMEGKYSYCNEKFVQDFSWIYQDGNLIGRDSLESVLSHHHGRLAEVSMKCLSSPGKVFQVEVDKPGINNTVKTTLWDMVFLADSSSQKEELQCVGIDITDRVKTEKENLFQANLLDKIGQAVIATDRKGLITYWNRAATQMYGWNREEVLGRNVLRFTLSSKSREKGKEILKTVKLGKSWSGELYVRRKDGSEFPALITDSPFFDEYGKFDGFIGVSSDITERKIADNKMLDLNRNLRNYTKELVTANKGLEQFSYIVSHNLRAPVANILGLGELIGSGDYSEDLKQQLLQEVISNINRLDNVITDLNDILQVKVGMSEKKEKVDFEELVENITSGISRTLNEEKVEIRTNFFDVPEYNAPKSYLHSIFSNLIINSIKYRRPEVELVIEIKSKKKKGKTILEFCDNGMGIDLEKKGNQVFGLYKRFHNHIEGKGMGLFMVKTQVELMGGVINVYSKVNEGTRFVLEFYNERTQSIEDEKRTTVLFG